MGDGPTHSSSEDQYFQILDTAPDAMIVVGQDEKIVFVNAQTENLFGYKREELLGQRLEALIPERFRSAHGGHIARYFAQPSVRTMGSSLELFGRRADGAELAIEVSLSPVPIAEGIMVSAAIRDISERKRMEADIKATTDRLASALQDIKVTADRLGSAMESIDDALALYDATDKLVLCNSAYRRVVESVSGTLVGRSYVDILDNWLPDLAFATDAERGAFRNERLQQRKQPLATFEVQTRDGRFLRVTNRRTLEGGVVKTIWDLTKDVEQAKELHQARAAAEAASAAKSDFLSSMSHELRTPLNAILGFAQLLQLEKKEPLSDRNKKRVHEIMNGGEHLLRLIDDILDLSRIEAGGISISPEPVSVTDVLDAVRRALEPIAARMNLRLQTVDGPTDLPMVLADRTRFIQILMNFGSNAIKYNRADGTITFTVSSAGPSHVRVTVSDTGMGIPQDKQDRLFQPFQRAGQETGPIEGTGIGLVITKRLAELMQGSVGFRSEAGRGSEFWVDLPVSTSGVSVAAAVGVISSAVNLNEGVRKLVLYVEDNPANAEFMRDLLGVYDAIELLTVPTAEIGVELAKSRRPTFIIMDINLPGMSGLDALRMLRECPETKNIPVIALTAAASERDRQRGVQAGFHRYLTKPIRVLEFEAAVAELLTS